MYLRISIIPPLLMLPVLLAFTAIYDRFVVRSEEGDNVATHCHDDKSGQTIMSGALGQKCSGGGADLRCEDRGKYIAYYNSTSHNGSPRQLIGYKESNVSMKENNREVRGLCQQLARGGKINLPAPRP